MKKDYIPIVTRGETAVVYLQDIFHVQQDCRRIFIYTKKNRYVFYRKLDELMPFFTDKNFYRCHKSCLINLEKVISMSDAVVTFENGKTLELGRESYRHARRSFTQYVLTEKPGEAVETKKNNNC